MHYLCSHKTPQTMDTDRTNGTGTLRYSDIFLAMYSDNGMSCLHRNHSHVLVYMYSGKCSPYRHSRRTGAGSLYGYSIRYRPLSLLQKQCPRRNAVKCQNVLEPHDVNIVSCKPEQKYRFSDNPQCK